MKPYADLKVKTREYKDKDGNTKSVYTTIGTMFTSEHKSHMSIKLDTVPVGEWNGWVSVFVREDKEDKPKDILPDDDDYKISLDSIPF